MRTPPTPAPTRGRRTLRTALGLLLAAGLALPAAASTLRYAEDQAPGIVNPLFSTTMAEALKA